VTDNGNTQEVKPTSLSGWKKAKTHNVRCPSGVFVKIIIPDLPDLIDSGQLPQHLVESAIAIASRERIKPSKELITQQKEFTNVLVEKMVVEPKLSPQDVADIPFEDKEFLVEVATRQTDFDAEGNHIGGLHTSATFRRFRGLGSFNEDVEGLFEG
jgi:hypothetical protein